MVCVPVNDSQIEIQESPKNDDNKLIESQNKTINAQSEYIKLMEAERAVQRERIAGLIQENESKTRLIVLQSQELHRQSVSMQSLKEKIASISQKVMDVSVQVEVAHESAVTFSAILQWFGDTKKLLQFSKEFCQALYAHACGADSSSDDACIDVPFG